MSQDLEKEQRRRLEEAKQKCLNESITQVKGFCPHVWDDALCWPPQPPETIASQPCPIIVHGFNPSYNATKYCESGGEWFQSNETGRHWTNFTQCIIPNPQMNILNRRMSPWFLEYYQIIRTISKAGHSISLLTLIIAFCILAAFKRLRCSRNKLHMNLFLSSIMRSVFSLINAINFMDSSSHATDSNQLNIGKGTWRCKMVSIFFNYFLLANYAWIFMEGLYLHNLIFLALFSDSSSIYIYALFGWGSPLIFVALWTVLRILHEDTICWTMHDVSQIYAVITVPMIISILLNFLMFINIIRVLMVKLKASMSEETKRLRRWAKSTLVLIPLFGIHNVLSCFFYIIQNDDTTDLIYLFVSQLCNSFQGCVLAVLYCFMNNEVREELERMKNRIRSGKLKSRTRSSNGSIAQVRVNHSTKPQDLSKRSYAQIAVADHKSDSSNSRKKVEMSSKDYKKEADMNESCTTNFLCGSEISNKEKKSRRGRDYEAKGQEK